MKTPLKPSSGTDPGRLLVVATPLGNLGDVSSRVVDSLRTADIIAAEDTRRTRRLLAHLGLAGRLVSYREHNEARAASRLVEDMLSGRTVALVTDAGTPAISDPGYRLVAEAHKAGIIVSPVAGPSALAAGLSASGLPADRFTFGGFPPAKRGARMSLLESLSDRRETLVFYEAPHRLAASLADMVKALGNRPVVMCRELTKLNEEIRSTDLESLTAWAEKERVRGEVTLVVAGAEEDDSPADPDQVRRAWRQWRTEGLSASQAARRIAAEMNISRAGAYRLGLEEDDRDAGEEV